MNNLEIVKAGLNKRYAKERRFKFYGIFSISLSMLFLFFLLFDIGAKSIPAFRDELRAMLKNDGPVPQAPFDGLEALLPARDYKNRHASILLAFDAVVEAAHLAQAQKE